MRHIVDTATPISVHDQVFNSISTARSLECDFSGESEIDERPKDLEDFCRIGLSRIDELCGFNALAWAESRQYSYYLQTFASCAKSLQKALIAVEIVNIDRAMYCSLISNWKRQASQMEGWLACRVKFIASL